MCLLKCAFSLQVQYPQSNSAAISKGRDLPPVAGSIIWAKQINHQLTTYLKRVEDVLGEFVFGFSIFCRDLV